MQIIPVKTPGFVKSLFPNFVWNINTNAKELYLTFDDGPTPDITTWVLSTLKNYEAKATFFCIGNNIKKHPEIFQKIISEDHSIGNHTFNHLKGWKHKTKDYISDVLLTQDLIDSEIQHLKLQDSAFEKEKLFRPPYGKFKSEQSKQLEALGYRTILWDVLSFDWDASVSKETCLKNITSAAKEGSIIVCHDSVKAHKNLKYALPLTLDYYTQKGFQFKAIRDL